MTVETAGAPRAQASGEKFVVPFKEGRAEQKNLLGGKGANLAEMAYLGLPVPPGFIITTDACRAYYAGGGKVPSGLFDQAEAALAELEEAAGKRLGDPSNPLLVSVRSGAPFSMPGMMDTILDLGINDNVVETLASESGDAAFAWDAYRRFVELYGRIVMGVSAEAFDRNLSKAIADAGAEHERGLSADALRAVVEAHKATVAEVSGSEVPQDAREQLRGAIAAVFRSWNNRRARDYRRMEGIPDHLGTAVTVQAMVFGNLGDDSATGVAFTRNPSTGSSEPYGDWLPRAQGEDVVAGTRHPFPLEELKEQFPDAHATLHEAMKTLEGHWHDLCDIEFTIERGRFWLLQTRVGKRTAPAALRIAVELVQEGLIDEREAVSRVTPVELEKLLHPQFDADAEFEVLTTGLAASPGAAVGKIALTADAAEERAEAGEAIVLVRPETSPDDLHGIIAAQGVLTARGGLVSHAAVVARGMGKPAICGAAELDINLTAGTVTVGNTVLREGDEISISGTTGHVVVGAVPLAIPETSGPVETLLAWADEIRRLGIRANADTPEECVEARENGAEGVGLARTEHMFLGDRLPLVQRAILAETAEEEASALAELEAVQRRDYLGILQAMDGCPVTVRLLDPPLHEFLPHIEELLIAEARGELDEAGHRMLHAVQMWREANPMLGVRGCRLGVLKPQLYQLQVRALIEAAADRAEAGGTPRVEIMLPLIMSADELEVLAGRVRDAVEEVLSRRGIRLEYMIGTMVETPRAALVAGKLAKHAAFFSFGTNDLTQMTFGLSRDDVEGRIMPTYLQDRLLPADPFETLDAEGVGRLIAIAVDEGRKINPDLEVGICGEHGGEPASIALADELGLDYVSCSPARLPVARLAAAHSALGGRKHRVGA